MRIFFAIEVDQKPIPEVWSERVGSYEPVSKEAEVINISEIYYDDPTGFLYVVREDRDGRRMGASVPTDVYSDRLAYTAGVGRGKGEVIEVLPNGNLYYNGLEFEKTGRPFRMPSFWL